MQSSSTPPRRRPAPPGRAQVVEARVQVRGREVDDGRVEGKPGAMVDGVGAVERLHDDRAVHRLAQRVRDLGHQQLRRVVAQVVVQAARPRLPVRRVG